MTRRISDKSKQILHMGEGKGKDYVPYILTSEFNSLGTTFYYHGLENRT